MSNNDYWAYLRDNNELKHYRTLGSSNKNHKYVDIDANGNYIYSETDTGARKSVPGLIGGTPSPVYLKEQAEQILRRRSEEAAKEKKMAADSKVSAAQARGQARQQASSNTSAGRSSIAAKWKSSSSVPNPGYTPKSQLISNKSQVAAKVEKKMDSASASEIKKKLQNAAVAMPSAIRKKLLAKKR